MIEIRSWRHFDWKLLTVVLLLAATGLVYIYSATFGGPYAFSFQKQCILLGISMVILLLVLIPDYHVLSEYSLLIFLGTTILLIAVLLFGKTVHGSTSWFSLGAFSLQPSEIAKVSTILLLARYLSSAPSSARLSLQELGGGLVIVGLPMILIFLQGDLGTMVTLIPVFAAMVYICGLRRHFLVATLVLALLLTPLVWSFVLKDFHKDRITSFLNPEKVPYTVGYQLLQSKIAIGSGLLFGKGIKQGTQSQLGFIPYRHTDFIFAVISEEAGFVGAVVVLLLFVVLFAQIIEGANTSRDRLGALLCVGVMAQISFQVCVNIGMVVGVLPIIGLPLPLLSYGGSSLLSTFLAIGIVLNVKLRRYAN